MNVIYKGQSLRYVKDFSGEEVLWITSPNQRNMEHMVFVGGYPSEYCIYLKELTEEEREDIKMQLGDC